MSVSFIATAADARHFPDPTMTIASWRASQSETPLIACDYGMVPEQVEIVRSVEGIHDPAGTTAKESPVGVTE